jgi:two-component system OmpR family response regulator
MNSLRILVVDDDPVTRSLLEKRLVNSGYRVETASSGNEALDLIRDRFFDVVLTDLMMPGGVDGIGVLEATKNRWNQTEVILITAYASVDSAVDAMKKGASDYLTKPINLEELMLRLQKINTLKSLTKDAEGLREAMDVTEKNAAQTIQDLEIMVSDLQHTCSAIKSTLADENLETTKRIALSLKMLSSLAG